MEPLLPVCTDNRCITSLYLYPVRWLLVAGSLPVELTQVRYWGNFVWVMWSACERFPVFSDVHFHSLFVPGGVAVCRFWWRSTVLKPKCEQLLTVTFEALAKDVPVFSDTHFVLCLPGGMVAHGKIPTAMDCSQSGYGDVAEKWVGVLVQQACPEWCGCHCNLIWSELV